MQIRRFIVTEIPPAGSSVVLPPAEAMHAGKVLRSRCGDSVILLDGAGSWADAVVDSEGNTRRFEGMSCQVLRRVTAPSPEPFLRLYVAPPRAKLMGQVVRCATELGVARITPVLCDYGVARPGADAVSGWCEDAIVAVKQSGNPWVPQIDVPLSLAEALRLRAEPGLFGAVSPPTAGGEVASSVAHGACGIWVGPEGGFSPAEDTLLRDSALTALTVPGWILRVETAVPALIGMLYGMRHDG